MVPEEGGEGFRKSFIEWISKIFLDFALVESEKPKNQLKLKVGINSLYFAVANLAQ